MKVGEYLIRYYDNHSKELKQFRETEEGLTVAKDLAGWRTDLEEEIKSFSIDRRIYDSLDKEEL